MPSTRFSALFDVPVESSPERPFSPTPTADSSLVQTSRPRESAVHGHPTQSERVRRVPKRVASSPSLLGTAANRSLTEDIDQNADWEAITADTHLDDTVLVGRTPSPRCFDAKQRQETGSGVEDALGLQGRSRERPQRMQAGKSSKEETATPSAVICSRCYTNDTPMWRPGPKGQGTLCNFCGLLYAKQEKRRHLRGSKKEKDIDGGN